MAANYPDRSSDAEKTFAILSRDAHASAVLPLTNDRFAPKPDLPQMWLLTQMYGPAVRCKKISSSWRRAVLHQCIRLLFGALAPGHHGYQRACDLIKR